MTYQINIAVLFHNIFNLHGDTGNLLALKRIGEMGNIKVNINYIDFNTNDFIPDDFDIIYCGPGEISYFEAVKQWLEPKKSSLEEFINNGKILFVTGTSIGLFSNRVFRSDGSSSEGLSLINCSFKEREYVYGGDLYYKTNYNNIEMEIFGSQIRMIDQVIDMIDNIKPFGNIIYGMGTSNEIKTEGIMMNNSIFTNTLGPVLVLNPWLTKEMINIALKNAGYPRFLGDFDMTLEKKSLEAKKKFTLKNNLLLSQSKK